VTASPSSRRTSNAVREAFLHWEVIKVFWGWLAVPKGTPVIQSSDLDGIVEKLRARRGQR
jgi:hypothetical protein